MPTSKTCILSALCVLSHSQCLLGESVRVRSDTVYNNRLRGIENKISVNGSYMVNMLVLKALLKC